MVRLTDRPEMTIAVYRGRKAKNQSINQSLAEFDPVLRGSISSQFNVSPLALAI